VGALRRSRPTVFFARCRDLASLSLLFSSLPLQTMNTGRRKLPHDPPETLAVNPEGEVFFITICCQPRGVNQLACEDVWRRIDETLRHRSELGQIQVSVVLAMPDHLHGLFAFPGGGMSRVIGEVKRWLASQTGVRWQRDFFDHRLRSCESAAEKVAYIRNNPVRAGLVERSEDWPYQR